MTSIAPYQGPISVKKSPIHGYGIFAKQDILPGEVIEICLVLRPLVKDKGLINYYFEHDISLFLPLGYGSIYNHSDEPNSDFYLDSNLMVITANKAILKDEEIFIYYSNNWFQERNIKMKHASRYKQVYHFMTGPLLRATMMLIILGVIIAGIHYLGSHGFPQAE